MNGALRRPAPLRAGSRAAVVALSSPIPPDRLEVGLAVLRDWGLEVIEGRHLRARHPRLDYLAGTDRHRAADFTASWTDPSVEAILLGRGGYGVQRVLELLDWEVLAQRALPPVVMGFSDATALLAALETRLGVAGIHGPVVTSLGDADAATREHAWAVLCGREGGTVLGAGLRPIVAGNATGGLLGGNLALLAASVGTPELPPADGRIVVLEDVSEQPRRLDRLLTQLIRSGWLGQASAVVCGDFTHCGDPDMVLEVLADRLGGLGVPAYTGVAIGHGVTNLAFPVGACAALTDGMLSLVGDGEDRA